MTASTIRQATKHAVGRPLDRRPSEVTIEFDVPAQMRDGVTLRANVYRPIGAGPWPVLMTRTPYGKDLPSIVSWLDPVQAARCGFIVVRQDTRGCFASDGEWEPFRFERVDGYDSVQWAAKLPGSNGQVGMFGLSYWGNSQWLAAIEQPPSLAAISPAMTWFDPMEGLHARRGAVELGLVLSWSLENCRDYLWRLNLPEAEITRRLRAVEDEYDRLGEDGYWHLPAHESPALQRHGVPNLGAISALDSPAVADWCRVVGHEELVTVPSLHTGGWYDVFLQGTLDGYEAMAGLERDARLIMGPWTHLTYADPVGQQVFGLRSFREKRDNVEPDVHGDANDFQLAWFQQHLVTGTDVELPEAPVRIFVMGRNEWRDESSWPLQHAVDVRWFLHADGSVATRGPDPAAPPSEFVYDPGDPVPTVGGHTVLSPDYPAGPMDQARVEARDDILVFTSDPLQEDLEVTGRVRAVLYAQSSSPSTDWVARLCDVHPDGRSINLCDGILRVSEGAHECGRCELDLWSTSNVFLRGHRIRVHVTSSSFPRWDRNLNTGNQRDACWQVARQRIYHDAARSSFIELPVVR